MSLSKDWVTGFVEAEGCFTIILQTTKATRSGLHFIPRFHIGLHEQELPILKQIQSFFGIGSLYKHSNASRRLKGEKASDQIEYLCSDMGSCLQIKHFFEKQTFQTMKAMNFILWARLLEYLSREEFSRWNRRPLDDFFILSHIRDRMNLVGKKAKNYRSVSEIEHYLKSKHKWEPTETIFSKISEMLFLKKSDIIAIEKREKRPLIKKEWLLGFIEGDGYFRISFEINKRMKFGIRFIPSFSIKLHERDKAIIEQIRDLIGFGSVRPVSKKYSREKGSRTSDQIIYQCRGVSQCSKLQTFFEDMTFHTSKGREYKLWSEALGLMQVRNKKRASKTHILEIARLRDQMNKIKKKHAQNYFSQQRIISYLNTLAPYF